MEAYRMERFGSVDGVVLPVERGSAARVDSVPRKRRRLKAAVC